MELLPGIVADGTALYLAEAKTLILSDLHIGYEEERRSRGLLLPKGQKRYFMDELDRLFGKHEISTVLLAGDIKHEFSRISEEEWRDVRELVEHIRRKGAEVLAVGGNHDNLIRPILDRLGIELRKGKVLKNGKKEVLVVHGDEMVQTLVEKGLLEKKPLKKIDTVVIGHEHPAMAVTDGLRTETVKCFLVGKRRIGRRSVPLVVMPSSNPLAFGTEIIRERPLGPLVKSFRDFSAFAVVEGKVLAFGRVERLQRLMSATR